VPRCGARVAWLPETVAWTVSDLAHAAEDYDLPESLGKKMWQRGRQEQEEARLEPVHKRESADHTSPERNKWAPGGTQSAIFSA
jgi:hypothetical protein